ncbi:MAG: hypothetical protein HRF40_01745 [Nitrososphaera sp.]|jgi:hypothetical protein
MLFKNKKGYLWVTLAFFAISLTVHWTFAWFAYVDEQAEHHQPAGIGGYLVVTMRDTMENWQSEFLQLIWQVAGLSLLLYVGSPQSKEGQDRAEEKIDFLIKKLDPANAQRLLEEWEKKYPKN